MLHDTFDFIKKNPSMLMTGFLLTFFSGFGQTVFVGAHIPYIQADFKLSNTAISGFYSAATLCSALLIIWTGRHLDHMRLHMFILPVILGLALGCFILKFSIIPLMLFAGFFLLRQCGQGLMCLSATTSVNRYFEKHRGRAMSINNLGGAAHIILFPPMAVLIANHYGWQNAWLFYGIFTLLVLAPLFFFLFRHHEHNTHARWKKSLTEQDKNALFNIDHWTRKRVLLDWRFYCFTAVRLIAPFMNTAIFFYQGVIAVNAGISALSIAGLFSGFTLASVLIGTSAGFVVDRYGEKPVLLSYALIYSVAMLAMALQPSLYGIALSFILMGAAEGMFGVSGGPLLARMYGTKHLGSIKSLDFTFAVLSTAISPILIGFLLDYGAPIQTILLGFGAYCLLACAIIYTMFHITKERI